MEELERIVERVNDIEVRFDRLFVLGYPIRWVTKAWHYNYRVVPFGYGGRGNVVKVGMWVGLVLALILLWMIFSF